MINTKDCTAKTYLNANEVAVMLCLTKDQAIDLIINKNLPMVIIGEKTFIPKCELDRHNLKIDPVLTPL